MTNSEDMEAILTLSALAKNDRKRRLLLSSLLGFKFSFFSNFNTLLDRLFATCITSYC